MQASKNHYISAMLLGIIAIGAYLFRFVFNAFIAHHLSKAEFGDFSVGMQTFLLVSSLLLLGTSNAARRFLSMFLKNHVDVEVKNYISWNKQIIGTSSFFFLLLLIIALGALVLAHLFDLKRIETYHIAIYMLFLCPIGAAVMLINSYLQCNANIYLANFLQTSARYILLIPLLFVSIYFFDLALTTRTLVFLILITFGSLLIIELVILFVKAPHIAKYFFSFSRPEHIDSAWKKTSFLLITSQIFFSIIASIDLYFVEIFGKNEHSVGEYAALLIVTGISWTISASICFFLAPLVAPNIDTNKPYLQKAVNNAALINAVVNFLVIVLIGVFLKFVLSSFGATYYNETTVLVYIILSAGFFIRCLCIPAEQLLQYSGHEDFVMKINMFELIFMLGTGIILTIQYGMIGAAITSGSSVSLRSLIVIVYTHKKLGYNTIGIF